jgi:hypothetical protein
MLRALPQSWVAMKQACGSGAADYKLDMKQTRIRALPLRSSAYIVAASTRRPPGGNPG